MRSLMMITVLLEFFLHRSQYKSVAHTHNTKRNISLFTLLLVEITACTNACTNVTACYL